MDRLVDYYFSFLILFLVIKIFLVNVLLKINEEYWYEEYWFFKNGYFRC